MESLCGAWKPSKAQWYYCLEDTLQRIQQRLYCITENGPDNLLFETATGTLATNLEEQILLYIKNYPDMSLIIIDTFQMVRGNKGDPSYGSDYDDIQKLKRISDSQNVAILLVHHLRKMGDRDPVNKLSGTTGISGAVDCVYILDKSARLEDVATLRREQGLRGSIDILKYKAQKLAEEYATLKEKFQGSGLKLSAEMAQYIVRTGQKEQFAEYQRNNARQQGEESS